MNMESEMPPTDTSLEVEHGVRCDECHRIVAREDIVVNHGHYCPECEEWYKMIAEGERQIEMEDERLFLQAYERSQGFY